MPLNLLTAFLVPVLYWVKDHSVRKKINKVVLMITYTPIALLSIVAFAAVNFILLPMAYAKAYLHKMLIVIRQKKKQHIAELMFFSFIGLPVMIGGQAVELKDFIVHLYHWNQKESFVASKITIIPPQVFIDFLSQLRQLRLV